jgi:hypothetical protein
MPHDLAAFASPMEARSSCRQGPHRSVPRAPTQSDRKGTSRHLRPTSATSALQGPSLCKIPARIRSKDRRWKRAGCRKWPCGSAPSSHAPPALPPTPGPRNQGLRNGPPRGEVGPIAGAAAGGSGTASLGQRMLARQVPPVAAPLSLQLRPGRRPVGPVRPPVKPKSRSGLRLAPGSPVGQTPPGQAYH